MASAQIVLLPSEAELYPSMMKERKVGLKMRITINGQNKTYGAKIIIKTMRPQSISAVLIEGILKGKENGWPDCLHAKIGPVMNKSSGGNFVSYNSIHTGDMDCRALLDYGHPEKSRLEVEVIE